MPQRKNSGLIRKGLGETLGTFDLQRTFAILSLICIAAISAVSAAILTRFLAAQLLQRDAEASQEVIQAVADTEDLHLLLDADHPSPQIAGAHPGVPEFFTHVASMPDVFRVAIFNIGRTIIWASDARSIGRQDNDNEDLSRALRGELVFELSDRAEHEKPEYMFLGNGATRFMETYIPVRDPERHRLLGIVEIYKMPRVINEGIVAGERLIWSTSAAGAVFLYLTLFWIVRRAAVSIRLQQERLIEAETMAAVGEMASGIAHGIRNPLAAIRTTAELALEEESASGHPSPSHEAARDIIEDVDRVDQMIRELLLMGRQDGEDPRELSIAELMKSCLSGLAPSMERQGVIVSVDVEQRLPAIRGERRVLHLAVCNVLSNALEAMPNGGSLAVSVHPAKGGGQVEMVVSDSGEGMTQDRMKEVFKPFVTGKSKGLGLGLPLTKRIVERHGGDIALASELGKGTTVTIRLPAEAA